MADLYTARTAIDFQQDLFHELGFGTGHLDEDELWGRSVSLALFIESAPVSPFFSLSFTIFTLESVLKIVLAELCGWLSLRANKMSPVWRPPAFPELIAPHVLSVMCWCVHVLYLHASLFMYTFFLAMLVCVGYTVKCFRMALSVTWPLGICS